MKGNDKIHLNKAVRRVCAFLALALLVSFAVYVINRTFMPKYVFGTHGNPMTSTYLGFYEMEEDTVDVLLLGSSQMGAALNPQDIYDEAGIRSYNLASNNQPLWVSYYWLKEALNYQSPKVVVLDCYMLFFDQNIEEDQVRQALDYMKPGLVKYEAVKTACAITGETNELSWFFTNLRYHERWSELNENDFTWFDTTVTTQTKGFWKCLRISGDDTFAPISTSNLGDTEPESFDAGAMEYLEKITELCADEGIELVLVKTPTRYETVERNAAVQEYADAHGLIFYDFNTEELYTAIDFDYPNDMYDSDLTDGMNAHANPSGARKMSVYIADAILGVNGLESVTDSQWEETKEFNEHIWQNFSLKTMDDPAAYLEALDEDRYTVFLSVKGDASEGISEDIVEAVKELGFGTDLSAEYGYSYIGIKNRGEITESCDVGELTMEGVLRNGAENYFVTSAGAYAGDLSSIEIDGSERSLDHTGINIVVYDNEIKSVVDSVCFEADSEGYTVVRDSE